MAEMKRSETARGIRYVWCGDHEPHGRHEWLKGARRMDCPGFNLPPNREQFDAWDSANAEVPDE